MVSDPRKTVVKEINKIIDSSGVDNADELKNSIKLMSTCPCYEKKKRAATERSKFMGECMRSAEKGGKGKDMKTCSVEWKENLQKPQKNFVVGYSLLNEEEKKEADNMIEKIKKDGHTVKMGI